ncbi:hypothetical protein CRUP_004870 [Coryphaenoides rupestris]|nr:hypothetical protein CRUP_004870 [Coryphaenoides rupestris]
MRHEEAMRLHGLCRTLRRMDLLQDVLSLAHRRALDRYSELDREDDFHETSEAPEIQRSVGLSELDREDDFHETSEAPEIQPHTQQKPDVVPPNFTAVPVTDIFQRLGPLSVFSARSRWGPVRPVCLQRGEGGLGLTLRGDSPVLVAGVQPGGCAASSASLLNWNRKKKREGGGAGSRRLGSTFSLSLGSVRDTESMY